MNAKEVTDINQKLKAIILPELAGRSEYPLPARQCLHWASAHRPEILASFLPDLEQLLRAEGRMVAAEKIAAFEKEVRASLA
jgi:hypothetical protein